MSNSSVITIGETPALRHIVQSAVGDFRWPIQFIEGDTGQTPIDVSADSFEFIVYDTDGTTPIVTLEVGTGIQLLNDSTIQVDLAMEDYDGFTRGCKYDYLLRQTVGTFRKPLFAGKFSIV